MLLSAAMYAANDRIDSLKALIAESADDSLKVEQMLELSSMHVNSEPGEAIEIARQAHQIAEKIKYRKGVAYSLKAIGIGYYFQGDFVEALPIWQQSLSVFETINHQTGVANMLSNIGTIYYNEGDYNNALDYYLRSLKVSEEIKDTLRILTALTNIGAIYNENPNTHDKALQYSLQALELSENANELDALATNAVNIGELYYARNDLDQALRYFQKSLNAMQEQDGIVYSMVSISKVYTDRQEFDKALTTLAEALAIADAMNAKATKTHALIALANTYQEMNDSKSSLEVYKQAVKLAREVKLLKDLEGGYKGLSELYSANGKFDSAYKYQTLYMSVKDSLYNIATDKLLSNQMFNFQMEKKQGEINLLKKDQELKDLDIQKQKVINGLVSAGFFSVFIFLMVAINQKKRISKEKDRSEKLLLNILPFEIAEELKEKGQSEARNYEEVTVLFTDFQDFTGLSQQMTAKELVEEINYYFKAFDEIVTKYKVEKIKTIGDAYMAVGGLPIPSNDAAKNVIMAALEMQQVILKGQEDQDHPHRFLMRIGIHSGPVVAGIVGVKKFQYDIWGDTVNTASRLESCGEAGRVNISEATYLLVKDDPDLSFTLRGKIAAKGKGEIEMYFASLKPAKTFKPDKTQLEKRHMLN